MRSRFFLIIVINVLITIVLIFHERFLTYLDNFIMPNSAELCKSVHVSKTIIDRLKVNTKRLHFDDIERELDYLPLERGGRIQPAFYSQKIAIIVPYRDRLVNLELFVRNIHPFLANQQVYYGLYVVEPLANLTFNKGLAMNAGFIEAMREQDWDCYIFHDVDVLPENDRNIYGCDPDTPKLLATAISAYGYSTEGYFRNKYFGGATAFTKSQFQMINGFSNLYYGWGLEDDDARERVLNKFPSISRLPPQIGRYYANCHKQQSRNPDRFILYIKANARVETDGLNSISYRKTKVLRTKLFTRIFISYKNN